MFITGKREVPLPAGRGSFTVIIRLLAILLPLMAGFTLTGCAFRRYGTPEAAKTAESQTDFTQATLQAEEKMEKTTLIIATDLHYLSPELTDHGAFFSSLISHSDGKVMMYSEELIDAFLSQVTYAHPDALILSGDLTFNGEKKSHLSLAAKLKEVAQAGIRVFVIPGNHDIERNSAASFKGDSYEAAETVTYEEFASIYRDFGPSDALQKDPASLSFAVDLSPSLLLLFVDANTKEAPSAIKEETLSWAADTLETARAQGRRVISVSHQNLLNHSSLITSGFTAGNADALLALYEDSPVICNLSGHIHMQHIAESSQGLKDIATSSLAVSPNQYGVIEVSPSLLSYRTQTVDVAAWAKANERQEEDLLFFDAYSLEFFKATCRKQAFEQLGETEEAATLAEYFAGLNAAYFSGRTDLFPEDEALSKAWQEHTSFLASYIKSILTEGKKNHCEALIPLKTPFRT